jgi:hypothetical protein
MVVKPPPKNTIMNVRVPIALRDALEPHLEATGQQFSGLVRKLLEDYLRGERVPIVEPTTPTDEVAIGRIMVDLMNHPAYAQKLVELYDIYEKLTDMKPDQFYRCVGKMACSGALAPFIRLP